MTIEPSHVTARPRAAQHRSRPAPQPSGHGIGAALTRAAGLLVGATCAGGLGVALAGRVLASSAGGAPARLDALVEAAVSAIGVAVSAWLSLSALLGALCLVARATGATWRAGERLVQRFAPAVVRRTIAVTVVAGLGVAVATGAQAQAPVATPRSLVTAVTADTADTADLGWVVTVTPDGTRATVDASPTRAESPAPPAGVTRTAAASPAPSPAATAARSSRPAPSVVSSPTAAASSASEGTSTEGTDAPGTGGRAPGDPLVALTDVAPATLVVQPGDSLWRLAARRLGGAATDARVAAAWPGWYAANRTTIGDDPNLILPGQVLVVPDEVTR